MNIGGRGCSSTSFSVQDVQYTRVCGKIIGYQQRTPDAFHPYYANRGLTIDDRYVDGISLTHGRNPHIWTFAAATHEIITPHATVCPCTNIHNTVSIPIPPSLVPRPRGRRERRLSSSHAAWERGYIPPYVGSDYFCDTASKDQVQFRFYPNDPLWDGQGCGRLNTCCSFNNPPWFMKELPSPTKDGIGMRLCADQARTDEDIAFESIQLYVQ